MKQTFTVSAVIAAIAILPAVKPARSETKKVTLKEVIALAESSSPDLALSAGGVTTAKLERVASGRLRLPRLDVGGNVFLWDEALEFDLGMAPPGMAAEPVTVRDRVTSQVSLTAALPLSAQLVIGHLIDVDDAALDEARANHADARHRIGAGVAIAYVQLLSARSTEEIARASLTQLEAQRERARILQDGGVLERVDVMRLDAAVARAQLQALQAARILDRIEAELVLVLGLPVGLHLVPSDELPAEPTMLSQEHRGGVSTGLSSRPDLLSAAAVATRARAGASVSRADLFPEVTAIATYQHNEGGGTFQPKNAWFVGVTASWTVWDWGHNWKNYKAASSRADTVQLAADRKLDRAELETHTLLLNLDNSFAGLAAARSGLVAADEALRIQDERFKVGKATTTDLLDAQTEATRARLSYATSRYAYFISLVALARAAGRPASFYLDQI